MKVFPSIRRCFGFYARTLALLLAAVPGQAYDLADPLNVLDEVPQSPAKHMLPHLGNSCLTDGPLPVPLSLLDAVERALCNNPQTRGAWANVKAQAAAVGTGWSAYLPTVNATGRYGYVKRETRFPGHGEFDSRVRSRNTDLAVNLNWVLYDFGLRAANLENARQLLNAANAIQDDTLQTVFFNTVQAFYEAQSSQALVVANREAEAVAEQNFKAAEAKYAAGVGALADQLQAQTTYAQATLKRVQAEGDLRNALGALAGVMGIRPGSPLQIAGMTDETVDEPLFQQAVEDLIDQAVRNHPKMLAARAQAEAARAQIAAARSAGWPTVSLYAAYNQTHISATPINNQGSSAQGVGSQEIGLQVSIPLFEGFGRQYKVRQAEALAESKQAELGNTQQQVSLEVWKSFQALHTEAENLKVTKTLLLSARQSFDVAQGRYKVGVGNIIELLKAQSDWSSANQQRLLALTRWQMSRLRLATSLGQLGVDRI